MQEQDVYLPCDTNYGSALLVYTLDGTQPGSNATVYAGGPIILTNTATLTVGIYRAGRTPVFRTEIYTRVPGVQMTTSGTLSYASGPVTITLSPQAPGATVLYRLENQDGSNYTAPIQLDGMDNGNGYFDYTSIAGGQTNPLPGRLRAVHGYRCGEEPVSGLQGQGRQTGRQGHHLVDRQLGRHPLGRSDCELRRIAAAASAPPMCLRRNEAETVRRAWGKIYDSKSSNACSNVARSILAGGSDPRPPVDRQLT